MSLPIIRTAPLERSTAARQGETFGASLLVQPPLPGDVATGVAIIVHHLSRHGLLIETAADCTTGQIVTIELPGAGRVAARIGERSGDLIACDLLQPLSADQWAATGGGDFAEGAATRTVWPARVRALVAVGSAAALWIMLAWSIR